MTIIRSLEQFKTYIKPLTDSELEAVGHQLEGEIKRSRNPEIKLGQSMMIDEVLIEQRMRSTPIDCDIEEMSDEQLLFELARIVNKGN